MVASFFFSLEGRHVSDRGLETRSLANPPSQKGGALGSGKLGNHREVLILFFSLPL